MSKNSAVYTSIQDQSGEEYFCPLDAVAGRDKVPENELDNCVEASTARRYSGNLEFAEQG